MKTSYSIGEFSQVTGLSVKTLRFYHEKGILLPSSVDERTRLPFLRRSKIEKARVIMRLRQMEFSIEDIATVLGECTDDADILNYLERQKHVLQQRIQRGPRHRALIDDDHLHGKGRAATDGRRPVCGRGKIRRADAGGGHGA